MSESRIVRLLLPREVDEALRGASYDESISMQDLGARLVAEALAMREKKRGKPYMRARRKTPKRFLNSVQLRLAPETSTCRCKRHDAIVRIAE